MYYSTLLLAEALGPTNTSQIIDLSTQYNQSIYRPTYAIYESATLARSVHFNYVSDPSGGNDYNAVVSIGGGQSGETASTPGTVWVRYLRSPSVVERYNITWAGQ